MSATARIIIGLVAGLAIGIAIAAWGSDSLKAIAIGIEPVGTLFINAIRMTVIPLVVSTLVVGIATTSGAGVIGRVGGRALMLFLAMLSVTATAASLVASAIFKLIPLDPSASERLRGTVGNASLAEQAAKIPTVGQWIVDLVPINPIKAAADGSMLPLIVFTLAFGIALTRVSAASREAAVRFFAAISDAMLLLVRWILVMAPIGIFALAVPLAVRLGLDAAKALAAYVVTVNVMHVVAIALLYPLATLIGRTPMRLFARAAAPAQAVAFSSRSSLAALPTILESAETILHLPTAIRTFFIPLAASVFRLGGAIGIPVGVLFIARLYGVSISPGMLATIIVMSIVTTFSVPGVPGGSIIAMVPVLAAAQLPIPAIGLLLAVDATTDSFRTTVNVSGHLAVATMLAGVAPDDVKADLAVTESAPPTAEAVQPT
jgi:proton glutamate symport protein